MTDLTKFFPDAYQSANTKVGQSDSFKQSVEGLEGSVETFNSRHWNLTEAFAAFSTSAPLQRGEYMADPTREEIDAKLQSSRAEVQTEIVRLQGHIDLQFNSISSKIDSIGEKLDSEREIIETKLGSQTKYLIMSLIGAILIAGVSAVIFFITIGQFLLQGYEAGIAAGTASQPPAQIERSVDDNAQGSSPSGKN